jgi:xanthine dehydrogenase accessory factor
MIELLEAALKALRTGETVALATIVRAHGSTPRAIGTKMLIYPDGRIIGTIGGGEIERRVINGAKTALKKGMPQLMHYRLREVELGDPGVCGGENDIFIDVISGKKTLLVIGAGHLGQKVAILGLFLGMDVIVFDDRDDYANKQRFPHASKIFVGDVGEELKRFSMTRWCCVVIATRGHELDSVALTAVINSPAGYIGMVGSKRKKEQIFDQLAAQGIRKELLDRVHAPIGLGIGAETPEEIAVSIMAEIIAEMRGNGLSV